MSDNRSEEKKFYDLQPDGANESHYLCQNGVCIARFTDLAKAIAARESFTADVAARYDRQLDQVSRGDAVIGV